MIDNENELWKKTFQLNKNLFKFKKNDRKMLKRVNDAVFSADVNNFYLLGIAS